MRQLREEEDNWRRAGRYSVLASVRILWAHLVDISIRLLLIL